MTKRAEKDGGADEAPPKKKAHIESAKTTSKGKENHTSHSDRGKGNTQKKGSIIIVSGDSKPKEKLSDPTDPPEQAAKP